MRLSIEEVQKLKTEIEECKDKDRCNAFNTNRTMMCGAAYRCVTSMRLIDTIEAQQQEIEKLKKAVDEWKYEAECHMDEVIASKKENERLQAQAAIDRKELLKFVTHIDIKNKRDCWKWNAFKDPKTGYGQYCLYGKMTQAHRASYKLFVGEIPKELFVLHKCDNRICVNPNHLYLGTRQDNANDMVSRNRAACGERNGTHTHPEKLLIGSLNPVSKVNEDKVKEIRRLYGKNMSIAEISRQYNVSESTIANIVHRRFWKHVK